MNSDDSAALVQEWFVLNDGRWAQLLETSRNASVHSDPGSLAAAA